MFTALRDSESLIESDSFSVYGRGPSDMRPIDVIRFASTALFRNSWSGIEGLGAPSGDLCTRIGSPSTMDRNFDAERGETFEHPIYGHAATYRASQA